MKKALSLLHPYPFEKLAAIKAGIAPPADRDHIALSIGEPKHPTPSFITEELLAHMHGTSSYPTTKGTDGLRETIADWLSRRFNLPAGSITSDEHVLPVNGTREALFSIAQCLIDTTKSNATVAMPNPFYQIYEGAALLAGAKPYYINCTSEMDWQADFSSVSADVWDTCQLLYICTPGNPTGAVINNKTLTDLINLAEKHDFIIASDECYSELYPDEMNPPPGLLQAAAEMGNTNYKRCLVFHSLSKRSNAPGIRSGFVAGDAAILKDFLRYRTYHGCTMAPFIQAASTAAWDDEQHVFKNRQLYREKFDTVLEILDNRLNVKRPQAGFYLWPETPVDDVEFAREVYICQNITVLPGSFLSRTVNDFNPGANHVRMALVAPLDECRDAAHRLCEFLD